MSNLPNNIPVKELMDDHAYSGHELLRHTRKTPTVLYGIFVELARQFYMKTENHILGTPLKLWSPDPKETEIWIDTEYQWEDEHPEKRPAIYVQLSPIVYASLTGRKDGLTGMNMRDGQYHFSRTGTGTVSFAHLGGTAGEACVLADSTLDYLDAFGMVIRDDFCFLSFEVKQRIPRRLRPQEAKERYDSVVTCEFTFQDKWSLKVEAEKLKVLSFSAGQRLLDTTIVQ
jgi:hypothetical protein